jgi:hypothetical protein
MALAILGVLLLPASRARAGEVVTPPDVRLVWVRAESALSCPSRAELEASVSARLGRPVFSEGGPRAIDGFVQRDGLRWAAHIYATDAEGKLVGSRELASDGPDCAALASAAALAIALVIDPDAALRPAPPAVRATPDAPPPHVAAPPPQPPAALPVQEPCPHCPPYVAALPPQPPAALSVQEPCPRCPPSAATSSAGPTSVLGEAVLAVGLLPRASAGFGLSVDVPVVRGLDATLGALLLPEVRTSANTFGFSLMAARAGACAVPWRQPRAAASVCADVLLGSMESVVYADVPTRPGGRFWAGAGGTAKLAARLAGPVVAEIGASVVVPFVRSRYFVENVPATVFQEPVIAGLGFAALGVSIP